MSPPPTVMGLPRRLVGMSLVAFATLLGVMELLALLDPAGTQMADEGDPFGAPPSAAGSAIGLAASVLLAVLGLWLALRTKRRT